MPCTTTSTYYGIVATPKRIAAPATAPATVAFLEPEAEFKRPLPARRTEGQSSR